VGGAGEILDREHRPQGLFQARNIAGRRIGPQELLVAFALNLDEVRHVADLVDVAKDLADAALLGEAARGRVVRNVDRLGGHAKSLALGRTATEKIRASA
jgi:hypothetical protein